MGDLGATVDFPVPVEPPISTMIGTSSDCRSESLRSRRDRALALLVAEHLARQLAQPVDLDRALAALGEVELDPPRQQVGAVGRDAGRDQRARHQPLRVRQPGVAERQRLAVAALAHARRSTRREREQLLVESCRDQIVRGEHDAARPRQRVLGDDVDRCRLQLDEVRVGIDEVSRAAAPVGEVGRDVHDVGVEVRDVRGAGREDGDPALERLGRRAAAARVTASGARSITTSEIRRR